VEQPQSTAPQSMMMKAVVPMRMQTISSAAYYRMVIGL
jgi:hypothetical protein